MNTAEMIQASAMLVALNIKAWSGKASDKAKGREVASSEGAVTDAVYLSKRLVFSQKLDDLRKLAGEARTTFYTLTLPWLDDGRRLCSAKAFLKTTNTLAGFKLRYEKLTAQIVNEYDVMKDEARAQLGGLYREEDYPADIAAKFAFEFRSEPIPSVDDIRCGLGDEVRAKLQADLRAQIEAAGMSAKRDIYRRAADCVQKIASSLPAYNPDAKGKDRGTFRDSLITNVADLLEGLDGLNFDNDQNITELGEQLRNLTKFSPEALRENDQLRREVSESAESILETMQGYCGLIGAAHGQEEAA